MSTTTIVFVALLLIIIVGLIYAITANLFSRRHYPPEYQYGYGYPPHYPPPPQYHHPDYRRERENSTSSFWAFMILLTIAAVLYLANAVTETGLSTNIPKVERTFEYPTKGPGDEKYSLSNKGDLIWADNDPQLIGNGAGQADVSNPYGEDEYGLRKDTIKEKQQEKAPDYTTGYGIQLFATEKDWLSEEAKDKLRRRFGGRPLLQSLVRVNGNLLNRTIIGGFDTKAEALEARRKQSRYFDEPIKVVSLPEMGPIRLYE